MRSGELMPRMFAPLAAAGGLAGAATPAMTGDRLACLPENAALPVRLTSALTVRH
jgi:hypothetical protein